MPSSNSFRIETSVSEVRTLCLSHDDPEKVWGDLLKEDREQIKQFYREMKEFTASKIPWPVVSMLAKMFYRDICRQEPKYINECRFFSDQIGGLTHEEMVFLQVQTTVANFAPGGCTTVAFYDDEAGQMVCMRSLDWGAADIIGKTTRIFDVRSSTGDVVGKVAGIAGMVGILTMVQPGFSVVGNYAPRRLDKKFRECLQKDDPTFLIRKLIEDEDIQTYQQAVDRVMSWDVGVPFFITICGVDRGEACAIEFGGKGEPFKRGVDSDGTIVQTNHYPDGSVYRDKNRYQYPEDEYSSLKRWYCTNLLRNSTKRLKLVKAGLKNSTDNGDGRKGKIEEIFRIPPVMNFETAQWVFLRPADATMEVTSLVDGGTCYQTCNFWKKLFCRNN